MQQHITVLLLSLWSPASLLPPQFILGNTGFKTAAISHRPSNADLLLRSARSLSNLRSRSMSNLAGAVGGNGGGNHDSSSRLGPRGQVGPEGAMGDAVVAAAAAVVATAVTDAEGSGGGGDKPA